MNLQKIKVYHLFWIVSTLIIIIGVIQNNGPKATLDINIHDTYFVVRNTEATAFLFICYFLLGTGYWLLQKIFKKRLVQSLTLIHSFILIGSFILYWIVLFYNQQFVENIFLFDNYWTSSIILFIELLLILFYRNANLHYQFIDWSFQKRLKIIEHKQP